MACRYEDGSCSLLDVPPGRWWWPDFVEQPGHHAPGRRGASGLEPGRPQSVAGGRRRGGEVAVEVAAGRGGSSRSSSRRRPTPHTTSPKYACPEEEEGAPKQSDRGDAWSDDRSLPRLPGPTTPSGHRRATRKRPGWHATRTDRVLTVFQGGGRSSGRISTGGRQPDPIPPRRLLCTRRRRRPPDGPPPPPPRGPAPLQAQRERAEPPSSGG